MAKKAKKAKMGPLEKSLHQPVKHHHALVAIVATVLLVPLAFAAFSGYAAGKDRFKFTVRGIVTESNADGNTLNVAVSQVSGKAKDYLLGVDQLFNTQSAKFYKVNDKNKKVRIKAGNVAVNQEVVITGVAKTDDTYRATEVVVSNRGFEIVGTVKEVDHTAKTFEVEISHTTYRSATYKGSRVLVNYGDGTTFVNSSGETVESDTVVAEQKVKVVGSVTGTSKWEATKVISGYTKSK